MPEQIISASGPQFGLIVDSDGKIGITGTVDINNIAGSIMIGSVSASVDSIYVQSGTTYISSGDNLNVTNRVAGSIVNMPGLDINNSSSIGSYSVQNIAGSVIDLQTVPNDSSKNNAYNQFIFITSGTATGITGSEVGSIIQFIGAGSYVQVYTWADDNINTIGSWS